MTRIFEDAGHKKVITQIELLAVAAARWKWRELFARVAGRRVVAYVDNDAARYSLIKGYSPCPSSASLVSDVAREEARCASFTWYERVPSKSNCADGPSRLDFGEVRGLLEGRVRVVEPPELRGNGGF